MKVMIFGNYCGRELCERFGGNSYRIGVTVSAVTVTSEISRYLLQNGTAMGIISWSTERQESAASHTLSPRF